MMAAVRIYGASDDLIEIEGAVSEGFGGGDEPRFVVLYPTEDVFRVVYGGDDDDRGIWRITHHEGVGKLRVSIAPCPPGEDPDPYSDVVTAEGDIVRAECWRSWPPDWREMRDRIVDRVDRRLSESETRAVWAALARDSKEG